MRHFLSPRWIVGTLALVVTVGAARGQESLPRSIQQVQHLYERRVESLRSNNPPPAFQGFARIVPERAVNNMVSIGVAGVPQQRGHFCAGVLIDPRWVLTAAHCVADATRADEASRVRPLDPAKLQILIGTNLLYRGGTSKPIARTVLHPDYRVTAAGVPENDLALLQFAEPLPGTSAPIASDTLAKIGIQDGDRLIVIGWGVSSFATNAAISDKLLLATVPVVGRDTCNQAYAGAVSDKMLCAGAGMADSCQGDSGGPAFIYNEQGMPVLIGVVSWGAGCTQKKYPGVYVNVTKYRDWINGVTGARTASQ